MVKSMKKSYLIILLTLLLLGGRVFADVVTTQRKIKRPSEQPKQTQPQTQIKQKPTLPSQKQTTYKKRPQSKLENSIRTCKPYSEQLSSSYMGMDIQYRITIEGWVNNKCRLNFVSQIGNANSSFKEMYGIDASDATILSFAPKIQCNFTRQQLAYVGDSILQENERNSGARNNMLKDPNEISISTFTNMGASDQRLMEVILNDRACTILNTGELNNMIQNLMQF